MLCTMHSKEFKTTTFFPGKRLNSRVCRRLLTILLDRYLRNNWTDRCKILNILEIWCRRAMKKTGKK